MSRQLYANKTCGLLLFVMLTVPASAQSPPWEIYEDPESASICDLINADSAEFVVLSVTGELVLVSGPDLVFGHTFVDLDGFVFFDGDLSGVIDFAEDGDGFRTLWWLSLTGEVMALDEVTLVPVFTNLLPEDFIDVPCDACDFWDDPDVCDPDIFDLDLDGIDDRVDLCPDTPPDEDADIFGCSCSQLDEDDDGVVDCFDQCPGTPFDENANIFGCSCGQLDGDDDGIDNCDDECPNTPGNVPVDFEGCPCDGDGDDDGVEDCFDECPNTAPGDPVNNRGCTVVSGPTVIVCGGFSGLTLMMTLAGMLGLGGLRPRRRRLGCRIIPLRRASGFGIGILDASPSGSYRVTFT